MKSEKEIREIIQLKLNDFNCRKLNYIEAVYDLQEFCKHLQLEALNQGAVSEQSELLINFAKFIQKNKNIGLDYDCVEREVEEFLNQ